MSSRVDPAPTSFGGGALQLGRLGHEYIKETFARVAQNNTVSLGATQGTPLDLPPVRQSHLLCKKKSHEGGLCV